MKKLNRIIALAILAVLLLSLAACNKIGSSDEPIDGLIAIQPQYIGEKVYDTQHTFSKSDFKLIAVFDNNTSREVTDFTFENEGMMGGVYIVSFKYGGLENEVYVDCEMDFFAD